MNLDVIKKLFIIIDELDNIKMEIFYTHIIHNFIFIFYYYYIT